MVNYLKTEGYAATKKRLAAVKEGMAIKGFPSTHLAAAQRAWNQTLRDMSVGLFSSVRANTNFDTWQAYPIPDPLWIKDGATTSLSYEDTPQRLWSQLDSLVASKGLWLVVVHKVGDDSDPGYSYSVSRGVFAAFCDRIAAQVKAGEIRVATIEQAVIPRRIYEEYGSRAVSWLLRVSKPFLGN